MDNATLSGATYDAFRAHPLLQGADEVLERRKRGELDVGQDRLGPAKSKTLHPEPPRESGDGNPHGSSQTRICLHTRLRHPPSRSYFRRSPPGARLVGIRA